jgi:DNA-binding transcriptional ArsR family regulator
MAYRLRFTSRDLLRSRFAISPIWETVAAVRALHDPREQPFHHAWLRQTARPETIAALAPLIALQPPRGWTPDFLSPTPAGPAATIDDELTALLATDPQVIEIDLDQTLHDQTDPAARRWIEVLRSDPGAATERVAGLLRLAWDRLVAPFWPRISAQLDADIAYHSRLLAEGGLEGLVPALHRRLSWHGDTLRLEFRDEVHHAMAGTGLVLIPSAFMCAGPALSVKELPMIVYPMRGVGVLWDEPGPAPGALGRLLGHNRARLLADLAEPASTTALARRHGLSPSTVSAHLTLLREAGLVGSRRSRHQVLYERTPLGSALLEGA